MKINETIREVCGENAMRALEELAVFGNHMQEYMASYLDDANPHLGVNNRKYEQERMMGYARIVGHLAGLAWTAVTLYLKIECPQNWQEIIADMTAARKDADEELADAAKAAEWNENNMTIRELAKDRLPEI